ncbi:hypothetical protein K2173_019161 [Erythroxylum novogranatense]|uniref:Glycosyltransferase n=1 Tax=Erythroxylum novogranatense TaxID=1862640 RepID=A0AAV8STI1_9ROSI|nr:hypothetical protein K2173_019161 [Erythroxylum novogranatense]
MVSDPKPTGKTHVFVFPFPIQGHINPMLQFSKRLASKGVKVTLLAATKTGESMLGLTASINVEPVFDGYKEGDNPGIDEYLNRFKEVVPQSLAELIENHSSTEYPVKCVIYDSVLPWVLDAARRSGTEGCPFFTQSLAVCALYYHALQGVLKVPLEHSSEVSVDSLPPLEFKDLPSFVYDTATYPGIAEIVQSQFSNIDEPSSLLWNTYSGLENEVEKWMASKWPVKPIGPTIPSMYLDKRLEEDKDYDLSLFEPSSEKCMNWLDSKQPRSVVYVSFGSLAVLAEDQMAELAWGLEKSNCNFLWVVRELEMKKLPTNFVEQTSSDKGLVVTWSPQLQVLAHKSVGCFFTHCGWNSTLEALSLGVPMVAMPQWTDQPTNAKFVTDIWHVGVRVGVDENGIVPKEEIDRCIRQVMEGEGSNEFRRNSEKLNEMARNALDEGGSSDKNIDEFISSLHATPKPSIK